jgi:hypothetical protein
MTDFTHKLVAVLNKSIEPGKLMNALAHISFGLGANITSDEAKLCNYRDADDGIHPNISAMPFIILRANSNKIRTLRQKAIENNIKLVDFTDCMTEGTYKEQMERSRQTPESDLTYSGIVLFGEWDITTELTRKFSLWK